jgi:hypothetical protein
LPDVGDGFGAEAFAATLDTEQEDSFRRGQAEVPGFGGKGRDTFAEPVFEHVESANAVEIDLGGIVFQEPAFPDDLLLFREHLVNVIGAEALFFDDDLGQDVSASPMVRPKAACSRRSRPAPSRSIVT